jgi:cytochrome c oxidase cbb3-type subunit III
MSTPTDPNEDPLRPHIYDGIQEYDKRLPNWWLWTLYGAIIYSIGYWAYYHAYGIGADAGATLELQMAKNAEAAARASGVINDETLWKFSHDPAMLSAGKVTFETTCASCHKPDLTGLSGPNLVDNQWIHGGMPMDVVKVIDAGVLAKGMPAWGPLLGKEKITQVTAYIMSFHKQGEEIVKVSGWTPPGAAPAPAPPQ